MSQKQGTVKITLYVVRHGECMANVLQKALNPTNDVLTEVGQTQAGLLGESLADVPFSHAYASDYPRGKETANIILKHSKVSKVSEAKLDVRLRERDYRGLYDLPATEIIDIMIGEMKKGTHYLDLEISNSETRKELEDRIIDFITNLIKDLRNSDENEENVLAVSHGLTIQRLMILLNTRAKDFGIENWTRNLFSEKLMRNTTYHEIVFEVPRDNSSISGHVAYAHFRDHVTGRGDTKPTKNPQAVQDVNNYTFLEEANERASEEGKTFDDQVAHYCKPV